MNLQLGGAGKSGMVISVGSSVKSMQNRRSSIQKDAKGPKGRPRCVDENKIDFLERVLVKGQTLSFDHPL